MGTCHPAKVNPPQHNKQDRSQYRLTCYWPMEYNPLITEPDDPDSYLPQSHSPPNQPIISQLAYKEVARHNVKSLAKLKVDIVISLFQQQFQAFILLRIKILPSATACLASHILFRVLALRLDFPLSL